MSKSYRIIFSLFVCLSLSLEGCAFTSERKLDKQSTLMSVQDYTGQGFSFNNGEKTSKFAKQHKREIIEQVDKYFNQKYGLKVTTHNLVGAKGAVVAFVESKQEPYFHTSVVVGVDLKNEKVIGNVFAYEGNVEGAIMSGLYVMAYEEEFKKLDTFCEMIAKKYPVVGMKQEAVDNTLETGYATPFYYTSMLSDDFPKAYEAFMKDSNISKKDLRKLIYEQQFDEQFDIENNNIGIALTFYVKKAHGVPSQKMANEIINEFKQQKGLPPGEYGIFLRSNEILKRTGTEKSYKGTTPSIDDIIIKLYK